MSSDDIAISVDSVSKRYELYEQPRDRLKQFVLPRLHRLVGLEPRDYFREYWALRDISFEVRKGESVGIVGRNGSGKSTLLQIITGTLFATIGTVETHGRIAALLELGSGFNPDFTGRENVFLNASLLGLDPSEVRDKFDDIAAFADIGEHIDQPVKTYSSGMLVRLAFAVQVQVQPDILIIDEALAVGDALFQKRCFARLARLADDGVTLLFVSHDQESVRVLTRRALLLDHGRMRAWGASPQVILDYRRQLHEEELAELGAQAHRAALAAKRAPLAEASAGSATDGQVPGAVAEAAAGGDMEFGSRGARILAVRTFDADGEPASVFFPGDHVEIRIEGESQAVLDRLNVGVRIRSKEGVKLYSWGTLNQDQAALRADPSAPVFWTRRFASGERFEVRLAFDCRLGANLYEIQAYATHEDTPDFANQTMLHWLDEAAFFQVLVRRDENFFGGAIDLGMRAAW